MTFIIALVLLIWFVLAAAVADDLAHEAEHRKRSKFVEPVASAQ